MSCFKVCQNTCAGYTQLANRFIDDYMSDANDAQLKVYLYLTRMLYADKPTSIADIADKFNYTEKDVSRALRYWDKLGLIKLCYSSDRSLESVQIINLEQTGTVASCAPMTAASYSDTSVTSVAHIGRSVTAASYAGTSVTTASHDASPDYEKPSYTPEQLKEFKSDDNTSRILFIAESYLQKTLSANEISSMLFIYDQLGFSVELIDRLIEYCVENGKKRMSYIEATAIDWAQNSIKTTKQADVYVKKYDSSVYDIMHALGKNTSPARSELRFITRWTQELGFSTDIISVACERTVLTTDKHRFEYADGILTNWYNAGVHTRDDIDRQDASFRQASTKKPSTSSGVSASAGNKNKFNDFKQRDYDFDALEKDLISN